MDSLSPPPDPKVPSLLEHREQARKSDQLIRWGRRVFTLVLTLAVILLASIAYQNRDLGDLVGAQREQFIDCQNVPATTPGCEKPVVSEKDVEDAKDGARGLPGLNGARGPRGFRGADGRPPARGTLLALVNAALAEMCGTTCQGADGKKGDKGEAVKGEPGESIKGDKGDKGDKGEKGDTGADGSPGSDGQDGEDFACPEGTTLGPKTVLTPENPLLGETIIACV